MAHGSLGSEVSDQKSHLVNVKLVILDRDGVLNKLVEYPDGLVAPRRLEDVSIPEDSLRMTGLFRAWGLNLAIASNQPDVARGVVSLEESQRIHQVVKTAHRVSTSYICFHDDSDQCLCRKPKPGMLLSAMSEFDVSPEETVFVGDSWRDAHAAANAGVVAFILGSAVVGREYPSRVEYFSLHGEIVDRVRELTLDSNF